MKSLSLRLRFSTTVTPSDEFAPFAGYARHLTMQMFGAYVIGG